MEGIPRIKSEAPSDARQRLFDIFFDIERKARLSGNAAVLLKLDRIPGLVLGAMNRVSEGAEDAALNEAYGALESILTALEQPAAALAG